MIELEAGKSRIHAESMALREVVERLGKEAGREAYAHMTTRKAAANSGAPICLVAYGVANVAALESSGLGIVLPIIGRKAA